MSGHLSQRVHRRLGWLVASGVALSLGACGGTGPSAGDLPELETVALDLAGNSTEPHCTRLPVLQGGRVLDEIDVAGEFSILVDATPERIELSFSGVDNADDLPQSIDAAALDRSFMERHAVETSRGRHFFVELRAECTP